MIQPPRRLELVAHGSRDDDGDEDHPDDAADGQRAHHALRGDSGRVAGDSFSSVF